MSYIVEAFVASRELLNEAARPLANARVVKLPQWMGLLPNTKLLFERQELGPGSGVPSILWQLTEFSPDAFRWMKVASDRGQIAYFEVHFFGGIGSQSAFVMYKGQISLGPLTTIRRRGEYRVTVDGERYGAVNAAMRHLGVERQGNWDEFDTLGFNRFRTTHEWDQDLADYPE